MKISYQFYKDKEETLEDIKCIKYDSGLLMFIGNDGLSKGGINLPKCETFIVKEDGQKEWQLKRK